MENLSIYEASRYVPQEAQKKITGGRLNGMTDINPMWRIKKLTELFGPAGTGWWTENVVSSIHSGPNGEMAVITELDLRYRSGEEISAPIHGVGGSMLIASERNGLRLDDEAFKKAYTDAVSVACKALGIGADVYWSADSTKYTQGQPQKVEPAPYVICDRCQNPITEVKGKDGKTIVPEQLINYSKKHFNGGCYCASCQKALNNAKAKANGSGN